MDQVANCLRHRKYSDEKPARARAAELRHKRKYKGVAAYPCKVGGVLHWHVGKAKRRLARD